MVGPDLSTAVLQRYCKACFQHKSTIDFDRTYETIIPAAASSSTIFVFAHGAAASRVLFRAHAQELYERFGHGAILWDLPGHASLLDVPLTLESCAETLGTVLAANSITAESKEKVIYVGGSLGAYVGFYLIDKFQDVFDGAILLDCGQTVGPGASLKARMGLVLLKFLGTHLSNTALLKLMADVVKKSPANYKLMETSFGAGMFFEHAKAHVECLKTIAPADHIPNIQFPILFMNGSEDYRDSENKWLELCANNKSELKVYQGGDHFFTHDARFLDDILTRFDAFSKQI